MNVFPALLGVLLTHFLLSSLLCAAFCLHGIDLGAGCVCLDGWAGVDCHFLPCLNNGTFADDQCFCTGSYIGSLCEHRCENGLVVNRRKEMSLSSGICWTIVRPMRSSSDRSSGLSSVCRVISKRTKKRARIGLLGGFVFHLSALLFNDCCLLQFPEKASLPVCCTLLPIIQPGSLDYSIYLWCFCAN
uniref:EGF-like domain-containing protein n=1 Tax=Plectus sambesii TaxID=2011161 RepID=A0A914XNJ8_9BILA